MAAVLCLLVAQVQFARAEALRGGGTGAAHELLRIIGDAFARQPDGVSIEAIPSLGSSGGIAAVADGALDFAVSGRALKPEEAAKGLTGVVLARSPFGFATSRGTPQDIKLAEIANLVRDEGAKWPDGVPIHIVLRPKSDSDTGLIAGFFPDMKAALERARMRDDIPVGATDQDNAALAEQMEGSLATMSLVQIVTERRKLKLVALDGVEPTLQNLERGDYPFAKELHFVFPAKTTALAEKLVAFLRSAEGIAMLRKASALPPAN